MGTLVPHPTSDFPSDALTSIRKALNGAPDAMTVPVLALRPRDACKALGIGERLLWSKTNSGEIPHVRIGRAVVYPVDLLREYLASQAKGKP